MVGMKVVSTSVLVDWFDHVVVGVRARGRTWVWPAVIVGVIAVGLVLSTVFLPAQTGSGLATDVAVTEPVQGTPQTATEMPVDNPAAVSDDTASGATGAEVVPGGAVENVGGIAGNAVQWVIAGDPETVKQSIAGGGGIVVREFMYAGSVVAVFPEGVNPSGLPGVTSAMVDMPAAVQVSSGTQDNPSAAIDRVDQAGGEPDAVFAYGPDGAGVRVYVVDTGVNANHVELAGRVVPGFSVFGDGITDDCHGHGTHVAAIAAGLTVGVAKAATVVPVRTVDCSGNGYVSSVVAGLNWVLANHPAGVRGVVNISAAATVGVYPPLDAAVDALSNAGLVVVVAAGNAKGDACSVSPGRAGSAITVAGSEYRAGQEVKWSGSNAGTCVDMFAPAVNVLSAWAGSPTAARLMNGTSQAAPFVAGVVAQALQIWPGETVAGITTRVFEHAVPVMVGDLGGAPNRFVQAFQTAGPVDDTVSVPAGATSVLVDVTANDSAGAVVHSVWVPSGQSSSATAVREGVSIRVSGGFPVTVAYRVVGSTKTATVTVNVSNPSGSGTGSSGGSTGGSGAVSSGAGTAGSAGVTGSTAGTSSAAGVSVTGSTTGMVDPAFTKAAGAKSTVTATGRLTAKPSTAGTARVRIGQATRVILPRSESGAVMRMLTVEGKWVVIGRGTASAGRTVFPPVKVMSTGSYLVKISSPVAVRYLRLVA